MHLPHWIIPLASLSFGLPWASRGCLGLELTLDSILCAWGVWEGGLVGWGLPWACLGLDLIFVWLPSSLDRALGFEWLTQTSLGLPSAGLASGEHVASRVILVQVPVRALVLSA